jgi:hypothetical protein
MEVGPLEMLCPHLPNVIARCTLSGRHPIAIISSVNFLRNRRRRPAMVRG